MNKKRTVGDFDLQISQRVRALMIHHGVTERSQTGKLSRVLKLSFAQAHRKMKGGSPWTLAQIYRVAAYFGETPGALIDVTDKGVAYDAVLVIGTKRIRCLARLGGEFIDTGKQSYFLAVKQDNLWKIYESERAPAATTRYVVESIEIRAQKSDTKRVSVAVVDDDKDSADSICDFLNEQGYRAEPYYTPAKAREGVQQGKYDGYVLDWILDTETAESLIREIRSSENPYAPIFLLTGQFNTGRVDETDIARVIRSYDVEWLEKPTRLPLLAAELAKKIGT